MSGNRLFSQIELTCKPIDSFEDIMLFLQNPPPWRSLCMAMKPHSNYAIRNMDIGEKINKPEKMGIPRNFCHSELEMENLKRHEIKKLPKTLVCHDMANGYHDDSFVDGTGGYDAYTFYNWSGIDIFCYFSHHLITIPPLGWINVGHAHGVRVIGTLITEWKDGEEFWDRILPSELERKNFASMLVAIAKTLNFDGWLLNVENQIKEPALLLEFVRSLHSSLHQELQNPLLIWYDSVTVDGKLDWQNGLNQKNKAFFDACDGMFTNYTWSERHVATSAALAGDRLTDLYVGLDVWGRNFYGGGQFNTHEAMKIPHKYGCSTAIFAPAWTHEDIPDRDQDAASACGTLQRYEQFLLRDRALWSSLWPYLNTRLPSVLPFQTSFCRGQGKKRRFYGEVFGPVPWYNLRHQQYQPNSNQGQHGYLVTTIGDMLQVLQRTRSQQSTGVEKYREAFLAIEEEYNLSDNTIDGEEYSVTHESRSSTKMIKSLLRIKEDNSDGVEAKVLLKSYGFVVSLTENDSLGKAVDPTHLALAQVPGELECLQVYLEDSFTGGSCLKVNPSDEMTPNHRLIRLFHCDFYINNSFVACVVTKVLPGYEDQSLNVLLFIVNSEGQDVTVVLNGKTEASKDDESNLQTIDPTNANHVDFKTLQKHLLLNEPGFYVPTENAYGWDVRYYKVHALRSTVLSVNCRTSRPAGAVLLGHFGLCHMDSFTFQPTEQQRGGVAGSIQN